MWRTHRRSDSDKMQGLTVTGPRYGVPLTGLRGWPGRFGVAIDASGTRRSHDRSRLRLYRLAVIPANKIR